MSITEEILGKDRGGARFVLALVAMHGIVSGHFSRGGAIDYEPIAQAAFGIADAMLLELERREAEGTTCEACGRTVPEGSLYHSVDHDISVCPECMEKEAPPA